MHVAQRMLLTVTIIITTMLLIAVMNNNKEDRIMDQWERIRTEAFLQHIIRNQELSLNEYLHYAEAVKHLDGTTEVILEIYRKEWDMDGNVYYFLISQEEILDYLIKENSVFFKEQSIISVKIHRNRRGTINAYNAIVSGKE